MLVGVDVASPVKQSGEPISYPKAGAPFAEHSRFVVMDGLRPTRIASQTGGDVRTYVG